MYKQDTQNFLHFFFCPQTANSKREETINHVKQKLKQGIMKTFLEKKEESREVELMMEQPVPA